MWLDFTILLLLFTSYAFIISIVGKIRIFQRWVWRIRFWIGVLWYVLFSWFFFTCWKSRCWCFCVWHFCTNRSQIQRWLTPFNIFAFALKFGIFVRNFKISFVVILSIVYHCLSNHSSFTYNIPRCAPMGCIWSLSYGTGSRSSDPIFFIQCINVRDPMANNLWSHGMDGLSRDVHPTARLDIPTENCQ